MAYNDPLSAIRHQPSAIHHQPMAQGLTDLSSALAMRLRDIARLMDRLDRLESGCSGDALARYCALDGSFGSFRVGDG
ncbi:MAG: hypothetical protein HZC38_06615 [Chloroflexi bacterium]|nr:hypothetical protein [Chloroflexota bacterium]